MGQIFTYTHLWIGDIHSFYTWQAWYYSLLKSQGMQQVQIQILSQICYTQIHYMNTTIHFNRLDGTGLDNGRYVHNSYIIKRCYIIEKSRSAIFYDLGIKNCNALSSRDQWLQFYVIERSKTPMLYHQWIKEGNVQIIEGSRTAMLLWDQGVLCYTLRDQGLQCYIIER